jgi:hypothetical protein
METDVIDEDMCVGWEGDGFLADGEDLGRGSCVSGYRDDGSV